MSTLRLADKSLRKLIKPIAKLLDKLSGGKITPNQITTVGIVMHIPIAFLIGYGHLYWAALFLVLFGIFDVLDGELARLQKRASNKGMIYDATTDRLKETLLYAGSAYFLASNGEAKWAYLPVLACGFSITVSYVKAKGEAALALKGAFKDHETLNRHFSDGLVPYGARMAIVLAGLLFNELAWACAFVAVLALITTFQRIRATNGQL
jgi:phosphatidylglycerophosphate synthase